MKFNKTFILWTIFSLFLALSVVGVALWAYGEAINNWSAKIVGLVNSVLSPSLCIGIAIKAYMNRKQLKAIDHKLASVGLTLDIPERKQVVLKGTKKHIFQTPYHTFISEKEKIIIKVIPARNRKQDYLELQKAMNEYLEQMRKEISQNHPEYFL